MNNTPLGIIYGARLRVGVGSFFHDLTTQSSLIGQFALLLCAIFTVVGQLTYWQTQQVCVPYWFFGSCLVLMLLYARIHYCFQSSQVGFYAGCFGPRFVMCAIAVTTALSFAADNVLMIHYQWAQDPSQPWLMSFTVPGTVAFFSLVYGFWAADHDNQDMLESGARSGSGRRTILCLMWLTFCLFGYHAYLGMVDRDIDAVFGGLCAMALSTGFCGLCYLGFQKLVPKEKDRGCKIG